MSEYSRAEVFTAEETNARSLLRRTGTHLHIFPHLEVRLKMVAIDFYIILIESLASLSLPHEK